MEPGRRRRSAHADAPRVGDRRRKAAPAGRRGPLVAVDGPAGSGKSTLARRLASALGLPYVNTGLMYRALARTAVDRRLEPDDEQALADALAGIPFDLGPPEDRPSPPVPELTVAGRVPGEELQGPDVERIVSLVARHPAVRRWMRDRQRALGAGGAVMEGRDIASVVFPDAEVKIFLSAPLGVRADRRAQERGARDEDGVVRDVAERDRRDAVTNPLQPSDGARVIDTTALDADGVFDAAMRFVTDAGLVAADGAGGGGRRPAEGPPKVAVVGRQNVGKSTLVNRLHGRKVAIADERPGITRDRLEVRVEWEDTAFVVIDTGGYTGDARGIELSVAAQAERAAREADLVVLVVDGATGVQEEDAVLARRLLRSGVPTMLVANKIDGDRQESEVGRFVSLGLGDPIPISALHGRGSGDLLDRIVEALGERHQAEAQPEDEARFAIVGKPNVGKSSLFNRVIDDERSVVHDEPGTTRDAVDSVLEHEGLTLRFIDTAGLRRRTRTQGVEFYGLLRTERSIEESQVALLVVDATAGLTAEDKRIAAQVADAGRGLVVVLNKWDLVDPDARDPLFKFLRKEVQVFPGTPVLRTSALRGTGVGRIVPALLEVRERWRRRAPTAEVNRVIERLVARHPPPRGIGRIRYVTQARTGPPTFVAFGIRDPGPQYRRYLENALRDEFGFEGVPVRLAFRPKEGRTGGTGRSERRRPRRI